VLLSLLVLPLYVPVLIMGAGSVDMAAAGLAPDGQLLLLAALLIVAAGVRSLGDRGALRISADDCTKRQVVQVCLAADVLSCRGSDRALVRRRGSRALRGGLYIGFFVAPTDSQQGEAYRIIFIHVPAAWMSMFIYVVMAFWAAIGLLSTRGSRHDGERAGAHRRAAHLYRAVDRLVLGQADLGHLVGVGRAPTSELILLFLYLGFMAAAGGDRRPATGERAGALLAIVGAVTSDHLYSVQWWNNAAPGRLREPDPGRAWRRTMLTAC